MPISLPIHQRIHGRGTGINPTSRFETIAIERDDSHDAHDDERILPRTNFISDSTRSIIAYNKSPDIPFEAGVNPYRGCEHGCAYCFARPFHEYLGFSAGLDFETNILVKRDAAALLRTELSAKSYRPQVISMSGITDVYQPIERKLQLTRQCMEVLLAFRNPVSVITKNHLVTRDIDLFRQMAEYNGVSVNVSITTLDASLSAKLEPRASAPSRRLAAIEACAKAGVPVGVMAAPLIPGLTDHELPAILKAAREAGATYASTIAVRLPGAVQQIFVNWLHTHYPDRAQRVINRIKAMRGGQLNDARFYERFHPKGETADQIRSMFHLHCRRLGFSHHGPSLSTDAFRRPGEQLALF